MMRSRIVWLLCAGCAVCVGVVLATDAQAKKGKKGKKTTSTEPAEPTEPPVSEAIAEQLGSYQWGMSPDEVMAAVAEEIKFDYQQKAAATNDTIKEDKLYQERDKKIAKMKKSYVEFKGQATGWDSSVVQDEYTHKNAESMLEVRREKWSDYFFFIKNPDYDSSAGSDAPAWQRNQTILWKLYRAFDAAMFPGLEWTSVQQLMTQQFGANPFKVKKFDKDTKFVNTIGIQWKDDKTLLTLINQFTFFGIFCLSFEFNKIHDKIDELRPNKPAVQGGGQSIIDSLSEGSGADSDSNIVDQLTGKGHGAKNAPPPSK